MRKRAEESKQAKDRDEQEQEDLLKAFTGTVQHYFGEWDELFRGIKDPRNAAMITYPLPGLLCTGVLMYIFRLGARREINHKLRENGPSREKFGAWFDVEEVPHGDTLNYAFKKLKVAEVQEVECKLIERLIRQKVLKRYRLLDMYYRVAIDGTGVLTFKERHCEHCMSKKLSNGETLYYHPVLEAKLVTQNGFAFSLMTEFIENMDPQANKQDCELKAFYRLAARLKERFPRLPICLLMDGLYACGPVFQLCENNDWKYLIVLQDKDLLNVHRSFNTALPHLPENHKKVQMGCEKKPIVQVYRWANDLTYQDSEQRTHHLSLLECQETTLDSANTNKHMWLSNFTLTHHNIDRLGNQGGRLRWKVENEGFNVQKNGGFNLQHPYSQDETAGKVFYIILQIAYLIFQLMEKGSLFSNPFPKGVGSLKNIADRILEAWRNLRLPPSAFLALAHHRFQIRFDSP